MSTKKKNKVRHHNRSHLLRKYESVYKECMKDKKDVVSNDSSKRKKNLNEYQKFVKNESKKSIYKDMKGSERLSAIASAWERKKRYNTRQKNRKKV